jgi:hypothetical protein
MNRATAAAPAALISLLLAAAAPVRADPVTYLAPGSVWKYRQGTQEASSPDPAAWRGDGFDDSGWPSGPAPFGFGDGPYGTDLSLLDPPMRGNYTTLFLRRAFQVPDATKVRSFEARVNYDDGLVGWINGVEVLRVNVRGSPGDPVLFDGRAGGEHESGAFEVVDLPDPAGYLRSGQNVLAIQVFNSTLTSADLSIDVEILDPEGPDRTPPAVAAAVPAPGATVRTLERAEVTFTEEVTGVRARDLLVNGGAASSAAGSGRGPYVFSFPRPASGAVRFEWDSGRAIRDLAIPPNAFRGGAWTVTFDPAAPAADLVINELVASNRGGLKDEDGEASDWIEVHNRGTVPVDLAGWSVTNQRDEPGWVFPPRAIEPGAYLVVFASGKDRRPEAGNLHASFQLGAGGEYLALYGPETPRRAAAEIAPGFPEQRTDHSFGLDDAGRWSYFADPTPGAPNGAAMAFAGFARDPVASVPRGLYAEPFSVELTSDTPGAEIRFTLDGSEPGESSELYTEPIRVTGAAGSAAATLRAAAFRDGYLPSRTATFTYIFPEEVLLQPASPPGFPATWGASQAIAADYALDPLVVGDPAHAAIAADGLTSVPALSLVMDLDDLLGPRGIYSNPSLEGPVWERPASAELIDPAGGAEFQGDCGVRIQGGSSTEGWKALKLSLRLFFKEAYGQGKLEHRFFPDSPVERFDTLVLDAHLNLTWNHPDHSQRVRSQYVRDAFVSDLQNEMGSLAPHSRFVNLYLNGLYWGLYDVHERPDGAFAAAYLGGEKEEYDVLRHTGSEIVDGSLAAWNAMMAIARRGLEANAGYESLQAYLDVRDLADYMIANIYAGNDDWPRHNWYAARRRKPGAGFRFFTWDAEHVLKDVGINQTAASLGNSPAELYALLRRNAEFRLLFADRVHRHFSNGGPLHVDPEAPAWDPTHPERNRPAALYMRRIAEIDAAIAGESARWGDVRRPGLPYTRNAEWAAERDWLLTQYFPRRSAVVLEQLRLAGLYPALPAPSFNRHGGVVEPGFLLSMTAPEEAAGTIYFTLDGSDPREYGTGAVAPTARIHAGPIALNDRTHVKARFHDGAAWSALTEAIFTLDAPLQALRIAEIMYNPPGGKDLEFIEVENPGDVTLELGGAFFADGIQFFFAAGTPIAPGERLVLVSNPEAFAESYPGVAVAGGFSGNLENAGERVTLVDRRGVVIASVAYDDERSWPIAADGFGHSLVLAGGEGSPSHPSSWRASGRPGGSPGARDPEPLHGGVVVSEVLARAASPLEEDAVEILNATTRSISVAGWYLSDQREDEASLRKFRIPAGTVLPPGGRAVFHERDLDPSPGSPASFSIDEAGGAVYLAAAGPGGNLTGYITGAEFEGSDPGVSFARHATAAGVDFAAALFRTLGADASTTLEEFRSGRGAPDAPPRVGPVVLSELRYHPPDGEAEFIEIHNLSAADVALHDAAAGRGWRIDGISSLEGTGDFELGLGTHVPARGYALVVAGDPQAFRARHGVPAAVPIVGPMGGALDNGGERIRLLRPALLEGGEVAYVLADQLRYDDDAPWPSEPDGGEPTLERRRAWEYGNDPGNWEASLVAGGTPGGPNSVSPPAGANRPPVAYFAATPAAGPAPLEVRFDAGRSLDPDGSIAGFQWTFGDGGSAEGPAADHTFVEAGQYAVTLRVTDGTGAQGTVTVAVTAIGVESEPLFRPLDANADGRLDGSDPIVLLGYLFLGFPEALPCGDGSLHDPANRTLLDANADARVDIADAVHLLLHLFASGPPPAAGTECVPAPGCPDTCR